MMQSDQYFGDFYLTQNLKSEFLYLAHTNVEAFSLSKKFLMRRIFTKFPDTFKRIKNDAEEYYQNVLRPEILKHKKQYFQNLNERTTYDTLKLKQKNKNLPTSEMPIYNAEASINLFQHQFTERIAMVTAMSKQAEESLGDFLTSVNQDFQYMIENISEMQSNLLSLKREINDTEEYVKTQRQIANMSAGDRSHLETISNRGNRLTEQNET